MHNFIRLLLLLLLLMFFCRNPTWWKRRSALERGLTVVAVSGVLLCVALVIGIAVIASNSGSCNETNTKAAGNHLSLLITRYFIDSI